MKILHFRNCMFNVLSFRTAITAESLSVDTKAILEEVTRNLNLEKLLPCYKYTVSVACLKVIRILQKFGHLPSNPHLFRAYAAYGQFIGIHLRRAAPVNTNVVHTPSSYYFRC